MLRKLIFIGLLGAGLMFAQHGGGGGGGRDGGMGEMGGEGMGGGMPRVTRMERISDSLKLNKDQKKELKSVLDEGQKEANGIKPEMAKARLAIAQDVDSGKSQDEVNQAVNSYAALEFQMTQFELKSFAKIFQSLDKDQQGKAGMLYQMMTGIFKGKNWDE